METSHTLGFADDGHVDCALIGAGRLGSALASALRETDTDAGITVRGPFGRDVDQADLAGCDVVLLCVPDAAIEDAAAALLPVTGRLVGHCSGAGGLRPLIAAGHEAFSLHPLMTVTPAGATFAGAGCAVDGTTERALRTADRLANALCMRPVRIREEDRVAYHAAASIASNYLVTLEDAAERLLATTGASRDLLVPLVRAAVENWAQAGPDALTGPIARGDEATVASQRATVADRAPELLDLFDTLADATRALAARRVEVPA
jgi:predicted short-subunit dehydrogenase-like oxidoreductase (DUF2520 family)